ncbi:class I SAM-dependent methyltransferase [Aquihabitans sp. McL0605]|uniref:class I SAM-dependent methyltransferase n=1 Tax=Aquihabitans sp. McL0605 TaxID=3415671 RepID=UPI003CEA3597
MTDAPRSRWTDRDDVPRGHDYDRRFSDLAASGVDVHGEADLVASLVAPGARILDAGCGTGRVAIELAARGFAVTGLDIDPGMLDAARRKAPQLPWIEGDLATTPIDGTFDAVVLAGNVLIFVAEGTEAAVVARCAERLAPGGTLIAGFQVQRGGLGPEALDAAAAAAGLHLVHRWGTWDRGPWSPGGDYQVSVHQPT